MTHPLLEIRTLSKAFGGVQAVAGVDLTVAAGERVALIGPNGAGKTTCFNMIGGQLPPDAGSIRFDGREIAGLSPPAVWRRGISRTFQVAAAFGSMTAREAVQVALCHTGSGKGNPLAALATRHRGAADGLLRRVGLLERADQPCGTLAYGDVKRVEVAMSLANRPRLLLLDEPAAGLADADRYEIIDLVAGLAGEQGIGVLFTEHDMDVVFAFADRVLVLAEGRVVAAGPPDAVAADPVARELYLDPSPDGAGAAGGDAC